MQKRRVDHHYSFVEFTDTSTPTKSTRRGGSAKEMSPLVHNTPPKGQSPYTVEVDSDADTDISIVILDFTNATVSEPGARV